MSAVMAEHNEELELFKDMVLRCFEREVIPNYEQWEKDHIMPREVWRSWEKLACYWLICLSNTAVVGPALMFVR